MGGAKKKIMMIVGIIALLGVGMGAGMLMKKTPKSATGKTDVGEEVVADATKGEGGEAKTAKTEGAKGEGEGEGEGKAKEGGEGKAKESAENGTDLIFTFDRDFTVNLRDPRGHWFVKTNFGIKANSPSGLQLIKDNVPPLRDDTIMLLSGKTPDEVRTPEGQERIKRELIARYSSRLEPDTVKEIYFDNLMVITR